MRGRLNSSAAFAREIRRTEDSGPASTTILARTGRFRRSKTARAATVTLTIHRFYRTMLDVAPLLRIKQRLDRLMIPIARSAPILSPTFIVYQPRRRLYDVLRAREIPVERGARHARPFSGSLDVDDT